jgi:ribosomal-protein-alanine acetyltransferase
VRLKTFLPDHVSAVLMLERKCGLEVWRGQDYMNLLLGDPHFHGFVATVADDRAPTEGASQQQGGTAGQGIEDRVVGGNEQIVGFIAGRILPPNTEIYKLAVESGHQRQKIGSRLLERFIGIAWSRGVTDCFLEVRPSNKGAIAFYHLHGFVEHSTRSTYYKQPPEDALVMLLKLKRADVK